MVLCKVTKKISVQQTEPIWHIGLIGPIGHISMLGDEESGGKWLEIGIKRLFL